MGNDERLRPAGQEIVLPPDLHAQWEGLRQKAVDTAWIHPRIPAYIVLGWANKKDQIDPESEARAAGIIAYVFQKASPTHILSIQHSGVSLGQAVQANFPQAGHVEAVKLETKPEADDGHIITQAYSYSRKTNVWFMIPRLPNMSRILVIDDVCAEGSVGLAITRQIKEHVVGFGVYFDKDMQGGLKKISTALGKPCFSVLRIEKIQNGRIILMEKEQALRILRL